MSDICLLDTSILLEILNVPNKAEHSIKTISELKLKIENKETLFLPMATIFETGNHIAQNGDGRQKRECAETFVTFIKQAIEGVTPFTLFRFPDETALRDWVNNFPDLAQRGHGIGDISIINDFNYVCQQHPRPTVYIWTKDIPLSSYRQCVNLI